jgi:putative addiction module killer protein
MYPAGYIRPVQEAGERELVEYQEPDGSVPFRAWLTKLKDRTARARIDARLLRIRRGNCGDAKSVGDGVHELRVDYGPGYRVYFAPVGDRVVVLLIGGDKRTQAADIKKAKKYWSTYQEA